MIMTKVLVATEKPFAKEAVEGIITICRKANFSYELLESYTSKQQLIESVATADALIVRSDIIDSEIIKAAPNLKIIVRAGAGYDNIDLPQSTAQNIVVMNTPGQNANAVAELVFGLALFNSRKGFSGASGTELKGKSIGIHAYGNVGKIVAKIAKGFGMEVYAFDPFVSHSVIEADGIISLATAEELYSQCQYVSLHVPATNKTTKSINYSLLSKMKENAVLINTARKEVIDEDDMLKLMNERADFSYISDIVPEKAEEFKKLFNSRVYFTPKKSGAQTEEANINAGIAAAKQIVDFITNNNTTFQVNK